MSNVYITTIKDKLKTFGEQTTKAQAKSAENEQRFLPKTATEENNRLWEQIGTEYINLRNELIDTFAMIRTALSIASAPQVEAISAEGIFFTDFPIIVTPADYVILSDTHVTNPLWQRFLRDQIKLKGKDSDPEFIDAVKLIESRLPLPKLQAYKTAFEGALSMLETMYMGKVNSAVLDNYMSDNNNGSAELFSIIGDGFDISNYYNKGKSVPESAKHLYDDVVLNDENGLEAHKVNTSNFNFTVPMSNR